MEKQAYYSVPLPNPLSGGEGINQSFIGALILLLCVLLLPACSQINISHSGSRQPDSRAVEAALSPATMQQFQAALELIALQKYQQAEIALQDLIAVHPSLAGLYLNLGMIYASTDRDELAQQAFTKAIELNPDNTSAYNELGILYRKSGKFEKALLSYQQALTIAPDYALAHRNIGILYDLYLLQPTQALQHYRRYQDLIEADDRQVELWIAEISKRVQNAHKIASTKQP